MFGLQVGKAEGYPLYDAPPARGASAPPGLDAGRRSGNDNARRPTRPPVASGRPRGGRARSGRAVPEARGRPSSMTTSRRTTRSARSFTVAPRAIAARCPASSPSLAPPYLTSRAGPGFRPSSVRAALPCGTGPQREGVDDLTSELGLPINQTLAMFDEAVKKMLLAFYNLHRTGQEHEGQKEEKGRGWWE